MFTIALAAASLQVTVSCKVFSCTTPAMSIHFNPASSLVFSELKETVTFTDMVFSRVAIDDVQSKGWRGADLLYVL